MKRNLSLIILLAIIASCSSPEDKLKELKDNWIEEETVQINRERLLKRYQTALAYLETHQMWIFPEDSCAEATADTLHSEPINFRIVAKPYTTTSTNRDVFGRLKYQWACKAYGRSADSLRTRVSKNVTHPSKETRLITDYVSEAVDKVEEWRTKNLEKKKDMISNILEELPSDENSDQAILFELPTGKTIRAHMPSPYSNLMADWDSLKNHPAQIMYDTYAADEAIIFFDDQDRIERVWWGGWIE